MKFLRFIWRTLRELSGEADYGRYCAHLRARHPGCQVPSEGDFFLRRLEDKYSRPSKCC